MWRGNFSRDLENRKRFFNCLFFLLTCAKFISLRQVIHRANEMSTFADTLKKKSVTMYVFVSIPMNVNGFNGVFFFSGNVVSIFDSFSQRKSKSISKFCF